MTLKSMREADPTSFMERARSHNEFASFEGDADMKKLLKEEQKKSVGDAGNMKLNLEEVLL